MKTRHCQLNRIEPDRLDFVYLLRFHREGYFFWLFCSQLQSLPGLSSGCFVNMVTTWLKKVTLIFPAKKASHCGHHKPAPQPVHGWKPNWGWVWQLEWWFAAIPMRTVYPGTQSMKAGGQRIIQFCNKEILFWQHFNKWVKADLFIFFINVVIVNWD